MTFHPNQMDVIDRRQVEALVLGPMLKAFQNEIGIEKTNEITSGVMKVLPISNMLLIFPSWLEHKAETNLKNNSRISVSFYSSPILEKKS